MPTIISQWKMLISPQEIDWTVSAAAPVNNHNCCCKDNASVTFDMEEVEQKQWRD